MKRVLAACIFQTLVFQQKDELGYSTERKAVLNREEVEKYKASLEKNRTRYKIVEETQQPDGAIVVRVRK